MRIVLEKGYASVALPLIGAGTGGFASELVIQFMQEELAAITYHGEVRIVRFTPARK